jgi:RNA polymerase sigma-70 factor (ECF subfamily)
VPDPAVRPLMKLHSLNEDQETGSDFEEAFCRLFDQQFPSLFRYLHRLTGDVDLAEDLAQEVFVRLHQRGAFPDDARGWLAAVSNNLLRDDRRTSKRRQRLLETRRDALDRGDEPSADEAMLAAERRALVRSALEGLSERDRRMLLLRHEGYSYREISHALGINEASVGTFLLRATAAFQAAFGRTDS